MGLDIYAGKLTRYYCHNWKTMVQKTVEEMGMDFEIKTPEGVLTSIDDKNEVEQTRNIVCQWRDWIGRKIDNSLPEPLWDEENGGDYYTDKPNWMAYEALVMLQVCCLMDSPLPEYVETGWTVFDEPIAEEAFSSDFGNQNSLVAITECWLPISMSIIFETELPTERKTTMSTVQQLKYELEELNRQLWNADEETILSWRNDKYYIPLGPEKSVFGFKFFRKSKAKKERFRTEDLAQSAYSILYQAVKFAEKHNVPIILDY